MATVTELIPILRNVSLFSSLSDEVLARVAADLEPADLAADEPIFVKGDRGVSMYIVLVGRVRIHDGDLIFTYRGPGELFGEMAALHTEERSASVTAEVDTRLLRLDQERMHRLLSDHPSMSLEIMDGLCNRLRHTSHNLSEDFEYMRLVQQIIEAAQALEGDSYSPQILDEVTQREDALGHLARVFRRMANEVQSREERLQLEVQTLRIEVDRVKQSQQVAEITETEYFRELREKANVLRRRSQIPGDQKMKT
jgi:CRP/FNR family cyclic AMP-dependent transcriptional regulator